jgi:hypothetical protein
MPKYRIVYVVTDVVEADNDEEAREIFHDDLTINECSHIAVELLDE